MIYDIMHTFTVMTYTCFTMPDEAAMICHVVVQFRLSIIVIIIIIILFANYNNDHDDNDNSNSKCLKVGVGGCVLRGPSVSL